MTAPWISPPLELRYDDLPPEIVEAMKRRYKVDQDPTHMFAMAYDRTRQAVAVTIYRDSYDVVGHELWCEDGSVKLAPGSQPGIYEISGLEGDGSVAIVSGLDNSLAAAAYGLAAIGLPATGHDRDTVRRIVEGREVSLILDDKLDAAKAGDALLDDLTDKAQSVTVVLPANGCVSLAEMRSHGLGLDGLRTVCRHGAGRGLLSVRELEAAIGGAPDLWRGWLRAGELALTFGNAKVRKSYILEALAVAVARGTDFLGSPVVGGQVVYVALEGGSAIPSRIRALAGDAYDDLEDPVHRRLRVLTDLPDITTTRGQASFLRRLDPLEEPPRLIVIDTAARALSACGVDENSAAGVGSFVRALDGLRNATGAAINLVHHTGRHGDYRGSGVLVQAPDLVWRVDEVAPLVSRLSVLHARDGATPDPVEVEFCEVPAGGETRLRIAGFRPAASTTDDDDDNRILAAVPSGGAGRSAIEAELGLSRSQTAARLSRLVDRGLLRKVGHGNRVVYVPSSDD